MIPSAPAPHPHLWQRLSVSLLALVALAAVLWPSEFQGGRLWLYTEWPWQATVAVGNVAGVGAALLAALLAWRSEDPAAPHLAAALGFGALAFGLGSHPVVPWSAPFADAVMDATILASTILAAAAFMRFSVLYPTRITVEQMAALAPPGTTDNALTSPNARTPMERMGARIGERAGVWARAHTPGWVRAMGARLGAARRRLLDRLSDRAPESLQKDIQIETHRIMHRTATRAWRYGLVLAGACVVLILLGASDVLDLIIVLWMVPLFWGWALLRLSYAAGGTEERRKILWILQGFLLFIGIQALVAYGLMIPTLFSDGARLLMLKLWPPALALGALAMVICLAIAVFWAGALDPGRALRSTVVYGGLGLVLTVVFALMENVASEYVVAWVGLPGDYAVLLSTAVTAVVFSALHRRFERAASGLFETGSGTDDGAPPAGALQPSEPEA